MQFTTTVKVFVAENPEQAIRNVKVSLFDRDRFSSDDLLGSGVTDANGEVRFDYRTEDFAGLEDRLRGGFPDLYAVAYDENGEEIVNMRAETVENLPRKHLSMPVPLEQAVKYKLITG